MKKILLVLGFAIAASGCSRSDEFQIPPGSDVSVQQQDGVTVVGRLVEVKPEHIIVERRDGVRQTVSRSSIRELKAAQGATASAATSGSGERAPLPANAAGAPASAGSSAAVADPPAGERAARGPAAAEPNEPAYREVTLPAGTVLPLTLRTSVGSDTSNVEDPVRATLQSPVRVDGTQVLPAGTAVTGHVTNAEKAGRVKGRAQIAFRFTRLDLPGEGGTTAIRTGAVVRQAPATKKRDAATIGGGAVGGAIIGGIVGGGDGAAKGAAIGGAGGTGVVLATRGKEVRMAAGAPVTIKLTEPVTIRVPAR